jgi:molybdopterin molybdotransferase
MVWQRNVMGTKNSPRTILSFRQAWATVADKLASRGNVTALGSELLPLHAVRGRVLAEDIAADRDYPPFNRATRDGYALRSADTARTPVILECVGEARAGSPYPGDLRDRRGCCVRIMTGAPVPDGADAVVMMEHTRAEGQSVEIQQPVPANHNIVLRGSEARAGAPVLRRGRRLGAGEIGLLASVGQARVRVSRQPVVAIIATGDEVVPVDRIPEWFQIRNSNAFVLAAAVQSAGGVPRVLDIAPDEERALEQSISEGLQGDLLVLSGGVSVGKYDLVERVLERFQAQFFFDRVAIRPGQPLVFGRVQDKFFFGLPGNPVSTFVTCTLFVRPAIGLLQGGDFEPPVFLRARLGRAMRHRSGLTMFMPARVENTGGEPVVNLVAWQGSGDLVGLAAANCFLVAYPEQEELAEGAWVDVMKISD